MTLYNTNYVITEIKDETKIRLFAENEYYDKIQIAFFDFYYNEGWVMDLKGNKKDVKRHSTIMNYLFKQNATLGWDSGMVEQAKKNAKQIKLDETKQYNAELKEESEKKASDMIIGIKNHEERYANICKSVENKTDEELLQLVTNTFKHASKKTIEDVLNTIKSYNEGSIVYAKKEVAQEVASQNESATAVAENTQNNNEEEVFYLNNNTFNTYSEAFSHAVQNEITTTKILSSKHPIMDNKRLQQLEYSFIFDKSNMSYFDKKEYFDYLGSIPNSLDRENRFYKLKGWIERYEEQRQRKLDEKQRMDKLALEASETLECMVANGLKIVENESMVKWYVSGQCVYTWFTGVSIEEYHSAVMNIHFKYFR